MRIRICTIVLVVVAGLASPAAAQPTPPVAEPVAEPTVSACTPACRDGFACHDGACISACNPACGDNEVCVGDGRCVSRCNPACEAGQTCTAAGTCDGAAIPIVAPVTGSVRPGRAARASKLGIVTAVVIAGLTAGIVIADDDDVGIPLGIAATAIGGVAIPLVASGGASARGPGSPAIGAPGMRFAGWVIYTLSLVDAVVLLGIALSDGDVPAPLAGSVGALGATSAVLLSIDASQSSKQARGAVYIQASVVRDVDGGRSPALGVACDF